MTDLDERKFNPHFAYPIMRDSDVDTDDCVWKTWSLLTADDIDFVLRGLRHGDRDDRVHLPEFEAFVCGYADDLHRGMTLGEAVAERRRCIEEGHEPTPQAGAS